MSETRASYDYEKDLKDMQSMVESTAELIDMHFTKFAEFLEDKNIGTLKAYRSLLERNLDQADVIGKQLVENKVTTFSQDDRVKLGSVFGAVAKIVDRIGYIDFLIKKRDIDFSKDL